MGPSGRVTARKSSARTGPQAKAAPAQKSSGATSASTAVRVAIFATPLGWIGLVGQGLFVSRLTIGHPSANAARAELVQHLDDFVEADWTPEVRELLERYAVGQRVDFSKVAINVPATTEFRRAIIRSTRAIPHGQTLSYGELASRAGRPRAARAVGTAMSTNRLPIIIPCHRVLASNGLGGYSATNGLELKRRLLVMEGAIEAMT